MRKMKMLAGIVLSVITVFASAGAVKAEEGKVTDRPKIKVDIETEAGERQISEEYFEALRQYLGWDSGTDGVSVQTSDTLSFMFDLEASGLAEKDIYSLSFFVMPPCYRDSDGKLKVCVAAIPETSIARAFWDDNKNQWFNLDRENIDTNKKNIYTLKNTEMYVMRVSFSDGGSEDRLFIPANYKEYEGDILQSETFNGGLDYLGTLGKYWKEKYGNVEFSNIHLKEKADNAKQYTVTFNPNTGSSKTTQKVMAGKKAVEPKQPTRKRYTFAGWYQGKTKYNFSKAVTADITLQAKWKKVTVKAGKLSKAKNVKGRKLLVKIKKLSGVKGYEISYAANKKFKSAKKKATSKTTITLTKLKKGKTYHVRVRAYKLDSKGKKVYGKWSNIKKVKIQK